MYQLIKSALLAFVVISSLAAAFAPSDYWPGKTIVQNVSVGGVSFLAASDGSAMFFNDSSIVTGQSKITALSQLLAASTPASSGNITAEIASLQNSTAACQSAYADFASGNGGVCYESAYNRFQCYYLWDNGIWKGLLPFDITQAHSAINASIPIMASSLARTASLTSQPAGAVNSSLWDFCIASQNFSAWNSQMLAYYPFNHDGGLYHCTFNATEAQDACSQASLAVVLSSPQQIAAAATAGATSALALPFEAAYAEAARQRDAFESKAQALNASFKSVRGMELVFASADLVSINAALENAANTDNNASIIAFNKTMADATSRLDSVDSAMAAYENATALINNATANGVNATQLRPLSAQLTGLELEMSLGNGKPEDLAVLSRKATALYPVSATAAATVVPLQSDSGIQLSPLLVGAAALAAAVIFAALTMYERGKH